MTDRRFLDHPDGEHFDRLVLVRGQHPDYDITRLDGPPRFTCSCGRSFESLRGLRTHQGHQRRPGWSYPATPAWRAHRTVVDA